jgi:hypothetical protein
VRGLRAQAASENFMSLGGALAAKVRLIVWCKACGHQVEPNLAAQVPALTDTPLVSLSSESCRSAPKRGLPAIIPAYGRRAEASVCTSYSRQQACFSKNYWPL